MRHEIGSFYEIGKDVEKTAVSRKEDAVERRSSLGGKEGSLKGSRICLEEKGLENWMRQASGVVDRRPSADASVPGQALGSGRQRQGGQNLLNQHRFPP